MKEIDDEMYTQLTKLGILHTDDVRKHNVGKSDYSKRIIQPWSIIQEYKLDYWDGDIIKRVLRNKEDEPRSLDYEKIIHICQEKLRQMKYNNDTIIANKEFAIHEDQDSAIKKGEQFLCTKDIYLTNDNGVLYTYYEGVVYCSEMNDCITDEMGKKDRYWRYPNNKFLRLKKVL